MKIWIFTFSVILSCCAGCRTYVGSDDIFETGPTTTVKSETGLELRRGVVLKIEQDRHILTFAERSVTRRHEKIEKRHCAKKYYYLDKNNDNLVFDSCKDSVVMGVIAAPVFLPLQWLWDTQPFVWPFGCINWKLRGENAPGVGYCIAYLPLVHMFFTPFLRPPYAYEHANYCEEIESVPPRVVSVTMRDRYIPVFTPDSTCGEVLISYGGQTISKRLSSDGKIEFGIRDFKDVSINNNPKYFDIVHRKWGLRRTIRTASLIEPEALRDWNILADERCDYPTRFQALVRLEPKFGERRCREYLQAMLDGRFVLAPIRGVEIEISEFQAAPAHEPPNFIQDR